MEETIGIGFGYGDGYGDGYGYGYGNDDGYGSGYGYGNDDGYGSGDGYGTGTGYGYGYGTGYGNGDGDGTDTGLYSRFLESNRDWLDVQFVLQMPNAEKRRAWIEALGAEAFFKQLNSIIVYSDIDGCGNQRQLLRVPLEDTEARFVQAVKVVCPTTKRVYYLGVPPDVKTCQEAVASTFGLKPEQYRPDRES